jgi:hypothetical protein
VRQSPRQRDHRQACRRQDARLTHLLAQIDQPSIRELIVHEIQRNSTAK